YTPDAGYNGADSFTYTVDDDDGATSNAATVSVTVTHVNDPPTANDDSAMVDEDSTANQINVLNNDVDIDGDTLTIVSVTVPIHGNASINGTYISYTPDPNYSGPDQFEYNISDGNGAFDTATVTITVSAVNDPAVANDDNATVTEDSTNNVLLVLNNDFDIDGDTISIINVSTPMNGTATYTANFVYYTPDPDYDGLDQFNYTISDTNNETDNATVYINVTGTNDPPNANADSFTVFEDSSLNELDVLANDNDPEGDVLTITSVTQPTNGVVTFTSNYVYYTPDPDFVGNDAFTYSISDGNGGNDSAPVLIDVTEANDPPNIPSDPNPQNGSTAVSFNANLSWNCSDPDGDPVMYDVYFGTNSSSLPMVSNNQSATTYDPGIMNYNTTYYWQIVTWDNHNASTASLIWNFTTTANHPPNEPSDPDPEDGATDVDIDADLSWTGGDPDPGDTITYDVYFGTTSPPPKVAGSQTATSYDPGTLDYSTTYYWQIVSWDSQGASTEGQIWHFTTKALLPPEITITKPEKGSFYLRNELLFPLLINTIVYGPIDITANATSDAGIEKVEFYINEKLKDTVTEEPYTYRWAPLLCSRYTIKVTAYDNAGQNVSDEIKVFKWRVHPVLLLAGTLFISKQLLRSLRTKTPFQWTILRGTVFNLKQVGDKYHGRAIRLHYTEIAPFSSVSGTGFIKLRKITFARVPFMLTYDIGPVGLTTYIFGIFPGKINRILA
ncbi:MAG: tandem-95 repeat protein, partial [Thermoplasmatales archaeon]|nr:tandem-95 repeat protein [Thermoplasmatales archaeon]